MALLDASNNIHDITLGLSARVQEGAARQFHQPGLLRPNRLNFAGCCVYCMQPGCQSPTCIAIHKTAVWVVCRHCDGTSYDAHRERICTCVGGLADMTHSEWINRPHRRPTRLNFAGFCIWCTERWCEAERCIDSHHRSTWQPCDTCDGVGFVEGRIGMCSVCLNGVVETTPLRGGRG